MNDYRELIEDLRLFARPVEYDEDYAMVEAADAIEQLVKERDAAVKELGEFIEEAQSRLGDWRGVQE